MITAHQSQPSPSPPDAALVNGLRRVLSDPVAYSQALLPERALRAYQQAPARAIAESIQRQQGDQFALVFSRQSGKDELLAQVLAWLLTRYQRSGGSAVVACPAFAPQAALTRDRLLARLRHALPARLVGEARLRENYIVEVGQASVRFLSAASRASARGQTADLLLIANEAQDIAPDVWDAVFDPMAASTNATTVFAGTTWSRDGLLSRQMRHLDAEETCDGRPRVWRVPWQDVAQELPAYGDRVRARIAQFGDEHPFIRTEYCLEELDGDGLFFPPERREYLRGDHPRQHRAEPGRRYAFLLDVAGEDVGGHPAQLGQPSGRPGVRDTGRDSTALTVVEIVPGSDHPSGSDRPAYHVVDRRGWTGLNHQHVYARIVDLARSVWRPSAIVVDATGIGAGLASFLGQAFRAGSLRQGSRPPSVGTPGNPVVIPFVFTQRSKSALGWDLIGLIEGGRLKEYADDGEPITRRFWDEIAAVTFEVQPGPGQIVRWGVPPLRGHDDFVMSLALVSVLDRLEWRARVALGHAEP